MSHNTVSSFRGRPLQHRFLRFGLIILSLIIGYSILNNLLGMKVVLLNYYFLPIALYYIFKLLVFTRYRSNNNQELVKSDDSLQTSYKDILLSLIQLTSLYFILVIAFSWLPAIFLSATIESYISSSSSTENLVNIITHYYKNLYLIVPWLLMIIYVLFLKILDQDYKIYSVHQLVHSIHRKKLENDTVHNMLKIFYSIPFSFMVFFMYAVAIYSAYILASYSLGLYYIKGVNLYILSFCFVTVFLFMSSLPKYLLRLFNHHRYSVMKMLLRSGGIILSWLLIPTLFINYFIQDFNIDSKVLLTGHYNELSSNIDLQLLFFIWALWWVTLPIISNYIYRFLYKYSKKEIIFINTISLLSIYSLFNNESVTNFLNQNISYILDLGMYSLFFLVVYTIIMLYLLFNKTLDGNIFKLDIFRFDKIEKRQNNAPKYYHVVLAVITMLTLLVIIENIFIVQKIITCYSLVNLIVLVYFMKNCSKLQRKEKSDN